MIGISIIMLILFVVYSHINDKNKNNAIGVVRVHGDPVFRKKLARGTIIYIILVFICSIVIILLTPYILNMLNNYMINNLYH